jgi:hypothetical protein
VLLHFCDLNLYNRVTKRDDDTRRSDGAHVGMVQGTGTVAPDGSAQNALAVAAVLAARSSAL